jgi:hypothetical protein
MISLAMPISPLDSARGLALFQGHQLGDAACALTQQGSGLAHDFAALHRRRLAPLVEALLRCRQGTVQVGGAGVGDAADLQTGGGIEHRQGFAVSGVAPLAVDQQLGIGIGLRVHSGHGGIP